MADFEVTSPDGRKFVVTAPEGATQDQVLSYAKQQFEAERPKDKPIDVDPTRSFGENLAAGAGKAIYDVGRGAGQILRSGIEAVTPTKLSDLVLGKKKTFADVLGLPTQADIDEARQLERPLMKTVGGNVGNIGTNVAMFLPTMMIPGANTVIGAGLASGTMGALAPTGTDESRLKNIAIGTGLGVGAQLGGQALSGYLARRGAEKTAEAATDQVQNAVRDQALEAGRKAGLVVPPSTVNPTLLNTSIESLGGKYATAQQASVANQKGIDVLGRQAIGLKPNAPLTEQIVGNMRKAEGQAYQAVKDVGGKFAADAQFAQDIKTIGQDFSIAAQEFPNSTRNTAIEALNKDLAIGSWSPTALVEKIKLLRSDASANYKAFSDPEKLALARAQRQAAEALDGLVERSLPQDVAQAYQAARVNIAKLHDIEAALTPGGHIDARVLAKIGENGRLTGELKTIADFAGNFPKAVQTGEKVGSPMVHALRPSIGSIAGGMIGGIPGAAVGAGVGTAIPWLARGAMLSRPGQALMASPSYSTGLLSGALPSAPTMGLLSRTAIPAIYFGQ